MADTAADILIDTVLDFGVEVIFGLPGDGINGIMESLRKRQDKVRFIHVRHEEAAAFMACAYAKYTGKLGVCLATSGPGGIHLLNGLYDAKMDGAPVLAITGLQFHDLIGTHTQQDVDLDKLFENVAVYNQRIMGPAHVENVTELACRTALAYRCVSHITIPTDFQEMTSQKGRTGHNIPHHVSEVATHYSPVPRSDDLRRAADLLNEGGKVCILAGRGALGCADELEAVAEKLAAPVVKALLGKAVLHDDSPYTTNTFGLLGTKPSQEAMEDCDTLLLVGSCNPYMEFYPDARKVRAVQIDHDPVRIGLRCPVEVGLVGDSRGTLAALLPLLKRNEKRGFLETAQAGMVKWRKLMDERASRTGKPMKPQVVAAELGKRLRNDAIVSCDSGTVATWWARHVPVKKGQMHSLSGNLATMANGLPYTIAAQIAYPDRQCVGFVGDGAFSMLMAEFSTAVKYKLPIKIVIVKNNMLGQIAWEQMVFLGNPEFACDLEPIDFVAFAKACGGSGFAIEDPAECGAILDRALATNGPVIIEALVDPHEPPMPPKATVEQAMKFSESLLRGTPDAAKIMKTVLMDKVHELV